MQRLLILSMALCARTAAALSPADIDRSLPLSTEHLVIRDPLAAVCEDGAVWLCWWQKTPTSEYGTGDPTQMGVFCRLIDPNGRDVVPPARVAPATNVGMHYWPMVFHVCATPDGGAMVFMNECPPEPPPSPNDSFASTGHHAAPCPTLIVHIDRKGRAVSVRSNLNVASGPSMRRSTYRPAGEGPLQVVFGPRGQVHCFFKFLYRLSYPMVEYVRLVLQPGRLEVTELRRFDRLWERATPRSLPPLPDSVRHLWWVIEDRLLVACTILGPDTLLAVAADRGKYDDSLGYSPGDSAVAYRIKLPTLSLLDSTRFALAPTAGTFYNGPRVYRAELLKLQDGISLYLPCAPSGVRSYRLSGARQPVVGKCDTMSMRSAKEYRARGSQVVDFRNNGYENPWIIDWFGFDRTGAVYHDSYKTDSVWGRTH